MSRTTRSPLIESAEAKINELQESVSILQKHLRDEKALVASLRAGHTVLGQELTAMTQNRDQLRHQLKLIQLIIEGPQ